MNRPRTAGAIHPEVPQCGIEGLRPFSANVKPATVAFEFVGARHAVPALFDARPAISCATPRTTPIPPAGYLSK